MAEAIAIVSILAGAAVAIVVPFIGARLERSRLKEQGREARTAELQTVLEGAAQHLYEAWTILYEVDDEARRDLPRPKWSDQRLRKLAGRLTDHVDKLSLDSIRITVRRSKESPVSGAYYRAQRPIIAYELQLRQFSESERFDQEKPPPPPTTEVLHSLGAFLDTIREFADIVENPRPLR
jgi:type II secretory pathway pseudopilin PulG